MAWDTTITSLVRYLTNDLDATNYTWTDTQIKKFILVSVAMLDAQLSGWTSITMGPHTIDFDALTLSPDPTTSGAPSAFVTLIAMGAATTMLRADYKRLSLKAGWKIVDDRTTLDGTNVLAGANKSYSDMFDAYTDALKAFQSGNTTTALAILSPYSSPNHWPFAGGFR